MQQIEYLRVLAFVGLVVAVFVGALGQLARDLRRRQRRKSGEIVAPRTGFRQTVRWTLYGLVLSGIGCIAYGYRVEPYWLDVTHERIELEGLPAGHAGIRVAHVSDLHCETTVRCEPALLEALRAEKPDLIVFTGDAINEPAGLPLFRETLTEMAGIAPTFAIRGNWDTAYWPDLDLFGGTGAKELVGGGRSVDVDGARLWLGGVPYGDVRAAERLMLAAPSDVPRVFLYHSPDLFPMAARNGMDLYLAGHTHGGQVALPLYGALITFSRFGKQFEGGRYAVGGTVGYVNRGIGMEGGSAPRVRFWARPELTIHHLVPKVPQPDR